MKRLLCIFFLFSFLSQLQAQNKSEDKYLPPWSYGKIALHSGDTINCRLRFGQISSEGLLQVLEGEKILTLSVKDVKSFSFFDEKKNRIRNFYALSMLTDESTQSRDFFMEYVYGNDRFSILNHKSMGLPYRYLEYMPVKKKSLINKKYLLDIQSGKLVPMSKENVLDLMQKRKAEVISFIENNSVKFKRLEDFITVLEYYASL